MYFLDGVVRTTSQNLEAESERITRNLSYKEKGTVLSRGNQMGRVSSFNRAGMFLGAQESGVARVQ